MAKTGKELYKELRREVREKARFEEIIYHLTEQNVEEAKSLLPKYDPYYVQNLIYQEPSILNFKLKADLFALTGELKYEDMSCHNAFAQYLCVRGIISRDKIEQSYTRDIKFKTAEEYENPIKENTLEWYILKDDQRAFAKYIAENNIDIYEQGEHQINSHYFQDIPQIACFFGAFNIIKYLIQTDVDFYDDTLRELLGSGNEKCVNLLMEEGYAMPDAFDMCIIYHHNSLAKKLYKIFGRRYFFLSHTVFNNNTELLLYALDDLNWNINERDDDDGDTALSAAEKNHDTLLIKFLKMRCAKDLKTLEKEDRW